MKLNSFWIVKIPDKNSELSDVCFESNLEDFACMVRGGFNEKEIYSVHDNKQEATKQSKKLFELLNEN